MTSAPVQAAAPARPARLGRTAAGTLVLAAVFAVAVALSLMMGANPLPLSAVWASLTGAGTPDTDFVVQGLRVPRTIAGVVAGAALGVAGALMQSFSRNPLADPGVLGVNAGAAFAVALTVAVFGIQNSLLLVWPAFLGALVVTVAVALVGSAGRGRADPIRLVLAGVAVGAVLSGITSGLMLSDPDAFDTMRGWNAGSLLGRGLEVILPVAPFVALGLLVAFGLGAGSTRSPGRRSRAGAGRACRPGARGIRRRRHRSRGGRDRPGRTPVVRGTDGAARRPLDRRPDQRLILPLSALAARSSCCWPTSSAA